MESRLSVARRTVSSRQGLNAELDLSQTELATLMNANG
jgi:hypothetical protein